MRTWINSLGAEWRNEIQFGGQQLVSTSFFQPLDVAQRWFVEPRVVVLAGRSRIFSSTTSASRATRSAISTAQLDVGLNVGRYAQARLGYLYDASQGRGRHRLAAHARNEPVDAGFVLGAQYDSRDTAFQPDARHAPPRSNTSTPTMSLGGDRDWERAELGVGLAVPFRRDVFWVTLAGGTDLRGDLPADRAFTLGGPGSFPGLELGELRVGSYWTIGTSYLLELKEILPIRTWRCTPADGSSAAPSTTASMTGTDRRHVRRFGLPDGTHLCRAADASASGATSTDSWSVWLSIGRPLGHGTILERGIFR